MGLFYSGILCTGCALFCRQILNSPRECRSDRPATVPRPQIQPGVSCEVSQYQSEPYCWINTLPLEFDPWDQSNLSLALEEYSMPTPPDSFSECTSSSSEPGCPEMFTYPWSPMSSPVEYGGSQTMDHSTFSQYSEDQWHLHEVPASAHVQDTCNWLHSTEPSVGLGLSRAPSYDSQSAPTLNSFPESDSNVIPTGVGLPFTAESAMHGPYAHTSLDVPPDFGYPYAFEPDSISADCTSFNPVELFPGSSPVFFPHGGQAAYSRQYVPPHGPPARPLLPRIEDVVASQPAFGLQRVLRPSVPNSSRSQSSADNVTNSDGLPHGLPIGTMATEPFGQADFDVTSDPAGCLPSVLEPSVEHLGTFSHPSQEFHLTQESNLKRFTKRSGSNVDSYVPDHRVLLRDLTHARGETKPSLSTPEPEVTKPLERPPRNTAMGVHTDSDQPQRNHPDYSRPPHPDGLYRCPYKVKGGCFHKPTKLKCNYDKYIDSHVKPFRCKNAACSKQEFSSTACLLRHEREAHGMHGHGDRPHLCYYEGCDRAEPGYGFPRRYNLFDHMKRCHDYTDGAVSDSGSPVLGGETQKKIKGAKRKPSSPLMSEPAIQRQKTKASPQDHHKVADLAPCASHHSHGRAPSYRAADSVQSSGHKHRKSYSGWTTNGRSYH